MKDSIKQQQTISNISATTPTTSINPTHHKLIEILSGSGAGIITSLLTTPLDVLKITLQVQTQSQSVISTTKSFIESGGIGSLYTGLKPTLIGSVTTWAIYFTTYSSLKTNISKYLDCDINSPSLLVFSAMAAGANTSILTAPIWVIRTRLITQEMSGRQKNYNGMTHAFVKIMKEEGAAGLYSHGIVIVQDHSQHGGLSPRGTQITCLLLLRDKNITQYL
ncbi:mitochondrial substrate carrier family protein [Cavenderia fasciculata]|uniref:Mitochondrial substrate carrier family protein n=1 Tax=Cavenderia fasciculata TaxID=261658 RepID=F4QCM3_CACFS|nr:mitochondrial substrate carrier family protein [Cavenderia fasciculata]EGG14451.1 mitochondrial substrate carrier family protein [Cavenderia fasciculata]|eukprot:XP_004353860.1 mitochondrial substrate carrier family protein [Cavenderia fasciculata]